ncbi:MAG: hypothetical protein EOO39_13490 [Cytophagaceae bacterium]|nr:MAG: hypothetical protein EOO39_13490 [Cytophagaceae bacterium]
MNVIEQTVEPKDGAVHVDVPAEWEGYVLKVTIERTEAKAEKPKGTGMSRFRGIFKDMSSEERADMDRQLTELRNEWERPIS